MGGSGYLDSVGFVVGAYGYLDNFGLGAWVLVWVGVGLIGFGGFVALGAFVAFVETGAGDASQELAAEDCALECLHLLDVLFAWR